MIKINNIFVLLLVLLLSILTVSAMKNPATVYCEELGYESKTVTTSQGDFEKCVFPDGSEVDGWDFFEGTERVENSYCIKNGYGLKVIRSDICLYSSECSVCVLEDGTEKTVSELMDLDVSETICGDGVCGIPENFASCEQDCLSGGIDGYCDLVDDGKCDIDCEAGGDKDCEKSSLLYWVLGGVILIVILFLFFRKFKKPIVQEA